MDSDSLTKPVALYYPSLEHSGGIERVVIELCRIFKSKGFLCFLVTDVIPEFYKENIVVENIVLPKDLNLREACWGDIVCNKGVRYVITNGAFGISALKEIELIHSAGAKVINTIHFSFPSPILFNEAWDSYARVKEIGSKCDAVAAVSKADTLWWRALGCNAYHVQNPFRYYKHETNDKKTENHTVIWVGRGAPQKKPLEALLIMAKVVKKVPDVKLYMIGIEGGEKAYSKILSELDIKDNVEIVAPTSEIGRYYQKASVHLLTSITESFCLVIAEAKSYHIPTLMYDIPFLELIEDGKGVIVKQQGDIEAMADSLINLLESPDVTKRLGEEAFTTLERFNDDEVIARWKAIFESLDEGKKYVPDFQNPYEMMIREIYTAWMNHCNDNVWKINFFDNIEKATGCSFERIVSVFTNLVMKPLKRIKRIMKN